MTLKIGKNSRAALGLVSDDTKISNPEPFEAFGLQKTKEGWVFVKLKYRDGNLIKVSERGPDVRAIILEQLQLELSSMILRD